MRTKVSFRGTTSIRSVWIALGLSANGLSRTGLIPSQVSSADLSRRLHPSAFCRHSHHIAFLCQRRPGLLLRVLIIPYFVVDGLFIHRFNLVLPAMPPFKTLVNDLFSFARMRQTHEFEISVHHDPHKFVEFDFWRPSDFLLGFGWIS